MRPKKRINRRRGKSVDEKGNKVKVKLTKDGQVRKFKYYGPQSHPDHIDEMGRLSKDVQNRQKDIEDKKFRKRANRYFRKTSKNVKRMAQESSAAFDERLRRKAKIKDISKLKNK